MPVPIAGRLSDTGRIGGGKLKVRRWGRDTADGSPVLKGFGLKVEQTAWEGPGLTWKVLGGGVPPSAEGTDGIGLPPGVGGEVARGAALRFLE